MKITITAPLYEKLPILARDPFDIRPFHHYERSKTLYLSEHGLKDLEKLAKEVVKVPDNVKGSAAFNRDLQHWIFLLKNKDAIKTNKVKAKKVHQAVTLLIALLQSTKRKHLYQRLEGSEEGIMLTYYVDSITYHEPRKDNPEYMSMRLIYEEFGKYHSAGESFGRSECVGLSPIEILEKKGYLIESQGLREDYEFTIECFDAIHKNIGEQYLASGIADDEGIDGNPKDDNRWWYRSQTTKLRLDKDGQKTKVVVDIFQEEDDEEDRYERDTNPNEYFWSHEVNLKEDEELDVDEVEADETIPKIEIPQHPYVACFDLKHHKRLRIHVGNLEKYEYDTSIRKKLILPETNSKLIDVLLAQQNGHFVDIIKGKTGGMVILCQGPPGTGKTLTAEVYAESLQKALYTIQCSQLGTDEENLESNLMKVLARGRRWGAVMLLDEADVYVHQRGNDLQQNAIVGVFLRVLEYHAGVLFLTTNRGDLVDDAILSRCTARIPYTNPSKEDQELIWNVMAETNGIKLPAKIVQSIAKKHNLSGRDIKNLLKLAALVSKDRDCEIDEPLIAEMKTFKPTFTKE